MAWFPSRSVDGAWDSLDLSKLLRASQLEGSFTDRNLLVAAMSVSEEEMRKLRNSSVQLPNGEYMAILGVFYLIHCLFRTTSFL
jgi:hypothetical protein